MAPAGARARALAVAVAGALLLASTTVEAFTNFETGQVRPLAISPDGSKLSRARRTAPRPPAIRTQHSD